MPSQLSHWSPGATLTVAQQQLAAVSRHCPPLPLLPLAAAPLASAAHQGELEGRHRELEKRRSRTGADLKPGDGGEENVLLPPLAPAKSVVKMVHC